MTTTVTTVTVSTVEAMALTGALGVLSTAILIALLLGKEIVTTSAEPQAVPWSRILNIGLVPILLSFLFVVGLRISNAV